MEHAGRKWYALRVRTKCEEGVNLALREKGYETFLPAYSEKAGSRSSARPYFPGYLFCNFNTVARLPILKTPNVLHVVSFGGGPAEVPPVEIDALHRLVASGVKPSPCPYLREGSRVRVAGGPLDGLTGIVIREAKRSRLVISVDLLMRSVWLEIDDCLVEAAPPPRPAQLLVRHAHV
jgi:transcription antitermination factor NusG